jgi:hypothetical protein
VHHICRLPRRSRTKLLDQPSPMANHRVPKPSATWISVAAENVWPRLQHEATQPSFRPPHSNIANGDLRMNGFISTYSTQFNAPFEHMKKIRSPMRNPDLAQATELYPLYLSSFNRVTECASSQVQCRER